MDVQCIFQPDNPEDLPYKSRGFPKPSGRKNFPFIQELFGKTTDEQVKTYQEYCKRRMPKDDEMIALPDAWTFFPVTQPGTNKYPRKILHSLSLKEWLAHDIVDQTIRWCRTEHPREDEDSIFFPTGALTLFLRPGCYDIRDEDGRLQEKTLLKKGKEIQDNLDLKRFVKIWKRAVSSTDKKDPMEYDKIFFLWNLQKSDPNKKTGLMASGVHYVLFVAYPQRRILEAYDGSFYGDHTLPLHVLLLGLDAVWKEYHPPPVDEFDMSSWKMYQHRKKVQTDDYECGVWAILTYIFIHFGFSIMSKDFSAKSLRPDHFRMHLLNALLGRLVEPAPPGEGEIETVGPFGPTISADDDHMFPCVVLETREAGTVKKRERLVYPDKEAITKMSKHQIFVWPFNLIHTFVQLTNVFVSKCRIPFYVQSPFHEPPPVMDVEYEFAMFYVQLNDDEGNLHLCAVVVNMLDTARGERFIQANVLDSKDREYVNECQEEIALTVLKLSKKLKWIPQAYSVDESDWTSFTRSYLNETAPMCADDDMILLEIGNSMCYGDAGNDYNEISVGCCVLDTAYFFLTCAGVRPERICRTGIVNAATIGNRSAIIRAAATRTLANMITITRDSFTFSNFSEFLNMKLAFTSRRINHPVDDGNYRFQDRRSYNSRLVIFEWCFRHSLKNCIHPSLEHFLSHVVKTCPGATKILEEVENVRKFHQLKPAPGTPIKDWVGQCFNLELSLKEKVNKLESEAFTQAQVFAPIVFSEEQKRQLQRFSEVTNDVSNQKSLLLAILEEQADAMRKHFADQDKTRSENVSMKDHWKTLIDRGGNSSVLDRKKRMTYKHLKELNQRKQELKKAGFKEDSVPYMSVSGHFDKLQNDLEEMFGGNVPPEFKLSTVDEIPPAVQSEMAAKKKLRTYLKHFRDMLSDEICSRFRDNRDAQMSAKKRLEKREDPVFKKLYNQNNRLKEGKTIKRQKARFMDNLLKSDDHGEEDAGAEEILAVATEDQREKLQATQERVSQATALKYKPIERNYGLWYIRTADFEAVKKGKTKKKEEQVTDFWVEDNFHPEFLALVKVWCTEALQNDKKEIFIDIPVGDRNHQTSRNAVLCEPQLKTGQEELRPIAPEWMVKSVPMKFKQNNGETFCLTYSLCSALSYIQEDEAATVIASNALPISLLPRNRAIAKIRELMEAHLPKLGRCQVLVDHISSSKQRRQRKRRKKNHPNYTMKDILAMRDPYPKVVIPRSPDASLGHAFCIVDDLIFDSSQVYALQMRKTVVAALCGGVHDLAYVIAFYGSTRAFQQYTRLAKKNY